jgi:hypothetical protein
MNPSERHTSSSTASNSRPSTAPVVERAMTLLRREPDGSLGFAGGPAALDAAVDAAVSHPQPSEALLDLVRLALVLEGPQASPRAAQRLLAAIARHEGARALMASEELAGEQLARRFARFTGESAARTAPHEDRKAPAGAVKVTTVGSSSLDLERRRARARR